MAEMADTLSGSDFAHDAGGKRPGVEFNIGARLLRQNPQEVFCQIAACNIGQSMHRIGFIQRCHAALTQSVVGASSASPKVSSLKGDGSAQPRPDCSTTLRTSE